MADAKISALPAISSALGTDEFPANQGGISRKYTLDQIRRTGYDVGTLSLATESFLIQYDHLKLSSTGRLTLAGTAELFLSDFGNQAVFYAGQPKAPGSFTVPDNWFFDAMFRLSLRDTTRATLLGSADLVLTDDFAQRSRIVLSGRG